MVAPGSCGVRSFLEAGKALRGSAVLSFAEAEAGDAAGEASGLVRRMNAVPDAAGAVDAAKSRRGGSARHGWNGGRGWVWLAGVSSTGCRSFKNTGGDFRDLVNRRIVGVGAALQSPSRGFGVEEAAS